MSRHAIAIAHGRAGVFGVAAGLGHREDAVARLEALHALAGLDHDPCRPLARRERQRRRELILARDDDEIDIVDGRCVNLDHDLVGARDGPRHLCDASVLERAELIEHDSAHQIPHFACAASALKTARPTATSLPFEIGDLDVGAADGAPEPQELAGGDEIALRGSEIIDAQVDRRRHVAEAHGDGCVRRDVDDRRDDAAVPVFAVVSAAELRLRAERAPSHARPPHRR